MRRRLAYAAAISAVVLVIAQLAARAHEAEVRHVTCEQHGEQLEAAVVAAHPDDGVARWIAVELDSGEHEQCSIANALQQRSVSSRFVQTPVTITTVAKTIALPCIVRVSVAALYRLAPKTSPPSAT